MLFTREALEQATHEKLARARASLFPQRLLVADLTCGIGSDLIALAMQGRAIGFEIDPERASYARHNLAVHGLEAEVIEADSLTVPWSFDYAFADPARRVDGRRTTPPEDFQPDPQALASRFASLELGCIKLSPLLRDEYLESLGNGMVFWSYRDECREVTVMCGKRTVEGRWAAKATDSGGWIPAADLQLTTEGVGSWFIEADPAAVRAHALGTLAHEYGVTALGDSNGYLTGERRVYSPWLESYRVLASVKADEKALRSALRDLRASTPVVKTRAKGCDPIEWAKRLRLDGNRQVIVAFYPVGRSVRAVILERPV